MRAQPLEHAMNNGAVSPAVGWKLGRPFPWSANRLVALCLVFSLGGLGIVVGWARASGSGDVGVQSSSLNLALTGLIVAVAGASFWLFSGRRAIGFRSRRLAVATLHAGKAPASLAPQRQDVLVASVRMRWYHRPACLLVEGKAVDEAERTGHERVGRKPCGICRP